MKYSMLETETRIEFLSSRLRDYEYQHFLQQIEENEFSLLGDDYTNLRQAATKKRKDFKTLIKFLTKELRTIREQEIND